MSDKSDIIVFDDFQLLPSTVCIIRTAVGGDPQSPMVTTGLCMCLVRLLMFPARIRTPLCLILRTRGLSGVCHGCAAADHRSDIFSLLLTGHL
jgi:hypothetical protein